MGRAIEDTYREWGLGVVTAVLPDQLPTNAYPSGLNNALEFVGAGMAAPSKRKGLLTLNSTPVTGSPALYGNYQYKRQDGEVFHILIGDNGRIERLAGGTLTNISTAWTVGTTFPDFATANNLCFITDGTTQLKLSAATAQNWGITRPAAPTLAIGTGTNMSGAYDVALTYYNTNTGHESSRSDSASITLGGQGLDVSWSAPADGQVTHVRVYLRKPTIGINFYLISEIAVGTTSTNLDVADLTLSILIRVAPDTAENDPPPTDIRYVSWHRSRLFALTREGKLHYSKLGLPEAFDPEAFERVNPDDGQPATGLLSTHDVLLIFKRDSTYVLVGDDPATWTVRLLSANTGCTSHRSVVTIEGIAYWWSEHGPVAWPGTGEPVAIGQATLKPTVDPETVNPAYLDRIAAAVDVIKQRVLWAVPDVGTDRLTRLLPYSYRLGTWESEGWNPMDVASLAVVEDGVSQPQVIIGGYAGQAFQAEIGYNDGVPSGTSSGTFTAGAASITTITDGAATFHTAGGGLVERYVYVENQTTKALVGRRRITSNDATSVTFTPFLTVTSGATYNYYIGAIDWMWRTRVSDFGAFHRKKRYEYLYLQMSTNSPGTTVQVGMNFNFDGGASQQLSESLDTADTGAIWDVSLWDVGVFGGEAAKRSRLRIGRTGFNHQVALSHRLPNIGVTLRHITVRGELLRDRS